MLDASHITITPPRQCDTLPGDRDAGRRRRLQIYAIDPAVRRSEGQVTTIDVPFESMSDCRQASRFVIDAMPGPFKRFAGKVMNLDDPTNAAAAGLPPSAADPMFAQQQVYAVCAWTMERFRRALGREPHYAFEGPLRLQPNAMEEANAYYDRELHALRFGWFRQGIDAPGALQPGALICTALSHDVIVHEMSHALLDGMRSNLLIPTNPDVLALHEGFADLVALFARFTHRDLVRDVIARTGGITDTLLTTIGKQFGLGTTGTGPLRSGIVDPAPDYDGDRPAAINYGNTTEPHARGSLLLSAVFEAFRGVYLRKTARWRQTFDGIDTLKSHPILIEQYTKTACELAEQFLRIVIRALDYLPPVDVDFGEFLRAMITADYDLVPEDSWQYREALVYAFRRYGIPVWNVDALDERALLWLRASDVVGDMPVQPYWLDRLVAGTRFPFDSARTGNMRARCVRRYLVDNPRLLEKFGLHEPTGDDDRLRIESVRPIQRISPDGRLQSDYVIEIVQWRRTGDVGWFPGGCTLIVGADGALRYVIWKDVHSESRKAETRRYLDGTGLRYATLFNARDPDAVNLAASRALRTLHLRGCC